MNISTISPVGNLRTIVSGYAASEVQIVLAADVSLRSSSEEELAPTDVGCYPSIG